jgi:geranylgeranyl diphosphate synthase, type II
MTDTNINNTTLQQQYEQAVRAVDTTIEGYLSHDTAVPEVLRKAMLYSLRAGGKRLRPVMVILACEACGGREVVAMPAAAAIEMIHTYSLIHDDLPAMDNDDFRRGQPTSHKVFGDGIAILAGDALLTYAFNILAVHTKNDSLARKLILELSHGAGAAGMIGGQVTDLVGQNTDGDLETVKYIHIHKTAVMFRAATRMGAICAEPDQRYVDLLGDYGLKLGLAFQIIDDLLDVTGTPEELGKQTRKDQQAGKLTYPSVLGVEESRTQAEKLKNEALSIIKPLGEKGQMLQYLAEMLVNRKS